MYTSTPQDKPWTVPMLADAKREGRKLVMLTAYDASFARTLDGAGTDLILVGDSLGMVVQGHSSTLPVTVDATAYHVACVARHEGARVGVHRGRSASTTRPAEWAPITSPCGQARRTVCQPQPASTRSSRARPGALPRRVSLARAPRPRA